MKKIGIVTVNYNTAEETQAWLNSFQELEAKGL